MIIGEPIVLYVSEAEANVLQHILSSWCGRYGKHRNEPLDPRDQPNHDRKMWLATEMCNDIRDELIRRHEFSKASESNDAL